MFQYKFEGEIIPKTQPFPNITTKSRAKNAFFEFELDLKIENFAIAVTISSETEVSDYFTL